MPQNFLYSLKGWCDIPALVTHYSFGVQALQKLGHAQNWSAKQRQAFLLGNQGPDPFFYAIFVCKRNELHAMGNLFQDQNIDASLDAFRNYIKANTGEGILEAYFCGYLCHFVLDRNMHPLVDAQSSYGSARAHTHGQVEADLDAMMFYRLEQNALSANGKISKCALACGKEELQAISGMYANVAQEIYGSMLSAKAFMRCIKDMRLVNCLLYTRRRGKRQIIARFERYALNKYGAVLFAPHMEITDSCDFDNHQKQDWIHPHTGHKSAESFNEIFLRALDEAYTIIALSLQGAKAAQLSGGLNFSGCP